MQGAAEVGNDLTEHDDSSGKGTGRYHNMYDCLLSRFLMNVHPNMDKSATIKEPAWLEHSQSDMLKMSTTEEYGGRIQG